MFTELDALRRENENLTAQIRALETAYTELLQARTPAQVAAATTVSPTPSTPTVPTPTDAADGYEAGLLLTWGRGQPSVNYSYVQSLPDAVRPIARKRALEALNSELASLRLHQSPEAAA